MCGVCRQWRSLAREVPARLPIAFDGLENGLSAQATLPRFRRQPKSLKHQVFSGAAKLFTGYQDVSLLGESITDAVLLDVATNAGPGLRRVRLQGTLAITDAGALALARSAPLLEELHLEDLGAGVTGSCLPQLLDSCRQLRSLHISNVPCLAWHAMAWWPLAPARSAAPAPPAPAAADAWNAVEAAEEPLVAAAAAAVADAGAGGDDDDAVGDDASSADGPPSLDSGSLLHAGAGSGSGAAERPADVAALSRPALAAADSAARAPLHRLSRLYIRSAAVVRLTAILQRCPGLMDLELDGPAINIREASFSCMRLRRVSYLVSTRTELETALWSFTGLSSLRSLELVVRGMALTTDHCKVLGMLPVSELRLDSHAYKQQPSLSRPQFSHVDNDGVKGLVDSICTRLRAGGGAAPLKLSLCGATALSHEAVSALLRLPVLTELDIGGCAKISAMDKMRLVAKVKAGREMVEACCRAAAAANVAAAAGSGTGAAAAAARSQAAAAAMLPFPGLFI